MPQPSHYANPNSWTVFNNWEAPSKSVRWVKGNWKVFDGLVPHFLKITEEKYNELHKLLAEWDKHFDAYGKDPTHENWNAFRPLRLSREEDWSDWLAWFIHSSHTGVFSSRLLGGGQEDPAGYARPVRLYREDVFNGYRADLVIEWRGNRFTHIEVKTGDEHLSKTFSTGQMLQKKYSAPDTHWDNFILLLSRQMPDWEGISDKKSKGTTVNPITWDDTAIALRRAFFADEAITWKALARVFLGAIEQKLVSFPGYRLRDRPAGGLQEKIDILKKGLNNEH